MAGAGSMLSVLLAACLAHTPAPVSERSLVVGPMPDVYTVQKYDTLYSVAWRYELDVNELAARNQIEPPYLIETGQRIALKEALPPKPEVPRPQDLTTDKPSWTTEAPAETDASAAAQTPPTPVPAPAGEPASPPESVAKVPSAPGAGSVAKPVDAPRPNEAPAVTRAKPPGAEPAQPAPSPAKPAAAASATAAPDAWRSPVAAKPTRGFGGGSKGLDYSLRKGTEIRAATSGEVVYAGPGLGGYRHLVIVKASERHLVAYGVNVRPNLKVGDAVRVGDAIARSGSGTTGGQFHFEVRDRGKPIDPSSLLGS